ncbi:MAG: flavodoxin FldA [Cyanobacteria bacterium P01_H01_bin.15]
MASIGLFYGTETGNTEDLAERIQKALGGSGVVETFNIADTDISKIADFSCVIVGCPTWNIGELQSDWDGIFDDLDDIDFSGKKVAYYGPGDQIGYSENYMDAMGILEEKISGLGGQTVGHWPTDGYEHDESKAVKDGKFVGLALDEDNQSELTDDRISTWSAQVKQAFGV